MRTIELNSSTPSTQRNWVMDTIVVLGIVAFGLFVLALEGNLVPLAPPQPGIALPFDLTR